MGTFRAPPIQVEAFKVEDGRYLISADPPRFVEAHEFELTFELVPDRRKVERRVTRKTAKGGRRRRDKGTLAEEVEVAAVVTPAREPRTAAQLREDRRRRDEEAITSVRTQVDGEVVARQVIDGGRVRLEPGQKPGTGRKACPKCHIVNPAASKKCVECGKAF